MTPKPSASKTLETKIAKAVSLQSQVDVHISRGNEAESERISRLYEAEIKSIFSERHGDIEYVLAKLEFSRNLLLAEHPMPTLVEKVFSSLKADLSLMKSDEA